MDFRTPLKFPFETHLSFLLPTTSNPFVCFAVGHSSSEGLDVPAVAPAIVGAAAYGHAEILRLLLPAAQKKVRQDRKRCGKRAFPHRLC